MNLEFFSTIWSAMAPGLVNHLWQSTLFAGAAGLLTLILRKNHARARYWVWLAASVKFLIPFSLLTAVGSHFAFPLHSADLGARTPFLWEEFVQVVARPEGFLNFLPFALAILWIAGSAMIVFVWCMRWRKAALAIRKSSPVREGREMEALRRITSGDGNEIRIYLSQCSMEPGIFGILRPVLVWPEGLSQRLSDAQLSAILAHEIWHVRRRDNLAAAIHMVVEATFWFHPMVWWLGARLVEERERACDEEVLQQGSNRHAYAESISKVCEFCVAAPLACVSGVTGADLKKRMVHIMTDQVARKLGPSKKLVLGAAGFLAIAVPIVFGMLNATPSLAQPQEASHDAGPGKAPLQILVSKDVMQGLILSKVNPEYPEAARKAHVQGTVVLSAVISETGDIEYLRLVSGPKMLVPPSIEAVKQWKYKPYVLNGNPVEVKTRIEVNFTLQP